MTATAPNENRDSSPRLRLRITAAAEKELRSRHPWVYSDSIRHQNRPGEPGELAVIYDRKDRFLAAGLFDPDSPIRVRILHAGKPVQIDAHWWSARLDNALAKRHGMFDDQTTGWRWLNGENDGFPGLVLDGYDTSIVLKLYTAAWFPRLNDFVPLILSRLNPSHLVLRLSRNVESAAAQFSLADGATLFGSPLTGPVTFREAGIRFEADLLRGQKTGFFLDQRENRRAVENLARGRRVLNCFSFSGGFSLYAARGGAASVTDLDISPHALDSSRRNFELNRANPAIATCPHHQIQADAFEWLASPGSRAAPYDLIILDPPSLARRESERTGALQAYRRLALSALERLAPAGILVASSCSAHVTADEFFETLRNAARDFSRPWRELKTTRHAPDHPAAFKEADYLKSIYLQLT